MEVRTIRKSKKKSGWEITAEILRGKNNPIWFMDKKYDRWNGGKKVKPKKK